MKGVLLVNLGSPESPTPAAVKPYLDEFLMDKYVIDVPFLLRALLVRGIILQTRPKKSAEAYSRIWTSEGSPLIVISKKMHKKVQTLVDIPVALAMRYGTITIKKGLQELKDKVSEIWYAITPEQILKLYRTMPERVKELEKVRGWHTKLKNIIAF
jgi:ferrochelatase